MRVVVSLLSLPQWIRNRRLSAQMLQLFQVNQKGVSRKKVLILPHALTNRLLWSRAASPSSESVRADSSKSQGSVTETLQAMQEVLSKADGLDPELHKEISEKLGACFKDALTAPSSNESVADGTQVGVQKNYILNTSHQNPMFQQ